MAGEGEGVARSQEEEAIRTLTAGFIASLHTPLDKVTEKLEELQKSQNAIIGAVREASDFSPVNEDLEYIHSVFAQIVDNTYKLEDIKKDMGIINERIAKMKKRAVALQQKKIQLEIAQADRLEKEAQREAQLNAKPAPSLLNSPSVPDATVSVSTPSPTPHRENTRQPSKIVILPPPSPSSPNANPRG